MIQVTDSDFYRLCESTSGLLIVDCWSPSCGPCRRLTPILQSLAEKNLDVTIAKLDVTESPKVATMLSVNAVPMIYFFKNGTPLKRIVGLQTEQQLQRIIDELKL